MNTQSASPRILRAPRIVGRLLTAAVLALSLAFGAGATQASAYTWTQSGYWRGGFQGQQVQGQYVAVANNGIITRFPGIKVPGPWITRSNATAGTQTLVYVVNVYQWSSNGWLYHGDKTRTLYYTLPSGSGARYLDTQYIQTGSGTWRVVLGLAWSWNGGTAAVKMDYNQPGDYSCLIAACNARNGYLVL
ncbi:MAG TPA: hypothetical protein VFJ94_10315 [Intrasporangium sp.]|uniref:hypothetical protein n=1 Tax=Intrasporangium sp. TaxID=1925024 RepID=UPI002D7817F8|nr:hypothetical protein [Intrasporangium sp.]HET7398903.1 hypothetical protein [Intrasporangium sp.]